MNKSSAATPQRVTPRGWPWSGPRWRSGMQLTSDGSFHSGPPPSPLKRKERRSQEFRSQLLERERLN